MRWTRLALILAIGLASFGARANASVDPPTATLTIAAGASGTESKSVGVPTKPPAADIEIAMDTTGSMGASIDQAKADAIDIVTGVQAAIADTQFAVVEFKDSFDIPEYQVLQSMTSNATDVQTAINLLFPSGGGDFPEAYNLVYQNSYSPSLGGDIGWRAGTRKFVIVIGDAEPHGAASAGFTDCSDTSVDPHALNTATELAGMATEQRTLFMILQTSTASTALACYQQLAAAAFAGGAGVPSGTDLATQIVDLINAATSTVSDVHLEVASAGPSPADASWVSVSPGTAGPVTPPTSVNFALTVAVPSGTASGTYTFDIVARADGADIGHQTLSVVVPGTTGGGCTRTIGLWKNHESAVSPLLPQWLGSVGGAESLEVSTSGQASSVLNKAGSQNGIVSLRAQLLAAKLNIASGADGSEVAQTITAADAFLATHGLNAWTSLSKAEKSDVRAWAEILDEFNSGLIGPGHC
jgi:hypothetical protein